MTITLLVVDILLTISLIVAINTVKEKQQRLNAEIKHSLRLEETVEELVKLRQKERGMKNGKERRKESL